MTEDTTFSIRDEIFYTLDEWTKLKMEAPENQAVIRIKGKKQNFIVKVEED